MELLKKAEEFLLVTNKSVNDAMKEYEQAQKVYEASKEYEWQFKVIDKRNGSEVNITGMTDEIEKDAEFILKTIRNTRKMHLESAEKRLAVLIGEKETVKTSCDNVGESQTGKNKKDDEILTEEKNSLENENTKPQGYKPWLDVELLRKELEGENAITITEFAKKYNCKKKDVSNAVERKHIQYHIKVRP